MVNVAQLVEHQVVVLGVEGSSPSIHPIFMGYFMNARSFFLNRYTQIGIATLIAFPFLIHLFSVPQLSIIETVFLIATTIFAYFSLYKAHPLTKPFFQQLANLMLFATSYSLLGLLFKR